VEGPKCKKQAAPHASREFAANPLGFLLIYPYGSQRDVNVNKQFKENYVVHVIIGD